MSIWMKNTEDKPSVSLTMMFITFVVSILWLLLSIFAKIGHLEIRSFDGVQVSSLLGPLIALYFGRRYSDNKFNTEKEKGTKLIKPAE